MQIKLKKVKLTNSILNQVEFLSEDDLLLGAFEVVGWCNVKTVERKYVKYILFQDSESFELRKLKRFYKVEQDAEGNVLFVNYDSSFKLLASINHSQKELFINLGWKFIKDWKKKGQFFCLI